MNHDSMQGCMAFDTRCASVRRKSREDDDANFSTHCQLQARDAQHMTICGRVESSIPLGAGSELHETAAHRA
jgi:hypothetical protein